MKSIVLFSALVVSATAHIFIAEFNSEEFDCAPGSTRLCVGHHCTCMEDRPVTISHDKDGTIKCPPGYSPYCSFPMGCGCRPDKASRRSSAVEPHKSRADCPPGQVSVCKGGICNCMNFPPGNRRSAAVDCPPGQVSVCKGGICNCMNFPPQSRRSGGTCPPGEIMNCTGPLSNICKCKPAKRRSAAVESHKQSNRVDCPPGQVSVCKGGICNCMNFPPANRRSADVECPPGQVSVCKGGICNCMNFPPNKMFVLPDNKKCKEGLHSYCGSAKKADIIPDCPEGYELLCIGKICRCDPIRKRHASKTH